MSEYHLHAKTHSRGTGKGAGGHARYVLREGAYAQKLVEQVNGSVVEQVRVSRESEVAYAESGHMPAWAQDAPLAYWDAADQYERANGTVYREIEFALPAELSEPENVRLAQEFAECLVDVPGGHTPYTLAIHKSEQDPSLLHCHLMLSDKVNDGMDRDPALWFRRAANPGKDPAKGGAPKTQARIGQDWLGEVVRSLWSDLANAALEQAGHGVRIDHRSLEARRIEQEVLAAQALERGEEVLAANHQQQADALDRPPQPKKGRVLAHGGAEKAPDRAARVVDFEAAKAARAQAVAARREAEAQAARDRQALERREALLERAQLRHGYRMDPWEIRERWAFRRQKREMEREAERLLAEQERQEQEERALDDRVAEETAPGVRQPQRTTWRAWRAQTLSRRYDPAYSAEMAERDIYCRWMPEHQGLYLRLGRMESERMEVIDRGPLLLAKNGVQDIPLLIETAKGKGWDTLEFTGNAEFQEKAAMAALEAGLSVADVELAQRARAAIEAAEREAIEQDIKERADSVGYRGEIEGWEEKQRADDPEYQRIIRDLKDDPSLTEMANVAYQQGRARGKREVERLERRDSDPALVADVRDRVGTWYHLSVFMHDGELAATLRRTLPSGELATVVVLKTVVPEKEQVLLWVGGGCIVMLAPNAEKDGVEMVIGERDESGNIQPVHERPGRLRANEALQNIPDHREGKAIEQALGVAPKMLNPAPPRQVYKAPAKTPGKQKGHGLDFDM